ncbi:ATP-binding cassette domain-containing protein [Pseudorhodobacter aquimaris]|uniref:ATP-binding cassette domain-containing protein n=1 Tax=Pseudorhodobacter aquimaris TaxID=687412 RepID=UPI00067B6158|nr:ATP-binding cassette domain-containing protein [Pseudorhodobacter aquimaris]
MSLELSDVSVGPIGGAALFAPISLLVEPGQVGTLMGPSGIGKSTLLDAIGGHLVHGFAASGRVSLNGRDVLDLPAEARRIGVLFQDAMLFPHLSVGDNLAFGLARHIRGSARSMAVDEALEQAGLAGFANRDPATLSGGQRARAALMRALLAEPQALLLDEPFSRLDASLRAEIRGFVFDHLRARAIPGLMVTHDASDAEAAGGIIVQL